MRIGRSLLVSMILTALVIMMIPVSVFAQDPQPLGTGLNPPTTEQAAWMQKNFPVIQKIRLNSNGLERINAFRKTRGMAPLTANQMDIAKPGEEAIFATSGGNDTQTTSILSGDLPAALDNSASQAFPPVRSQGSLGSCVAWATTYYQFTYETNLALGRNAKSGDNNVIFSPKWTYNMINRGANNGSSFSEAYSLEMKNGAASWSDFPYDANYLAWDMDPAHWNKAINYRIQSTGSIYNSNVDTMIANIKTQVANGHIMVIGTYVNSWVKTQISNDPATTADDNYTGQYIASYERNTSQGGHGMTIVGYNDDLWCDLNGNGAVDPGEKGAFKIANSWGTGDWNGGFRWITYDSLRTASIAPTSATWPTSDRMTGGIFFSGTVYTLTVSPTIYTPTMKAEITLNQLKRGQVGVTLGIGSTSSSTPTYTWSPKAVNYSGGDYAFNGTTTACDGTFVFDFTDLTKYASGTNRWFIGIKDSTTGDVTSISSFKLYQGNTLVGTAGSLPKTSDGTQVYTWIDYAFNSYSQLPMAVITTDRITGDAPLTVRLDGSSSTSPVGNAITGYFWTFGDGASASAALVDHTYQSPGQYAATLTVTDSQNNTGTKSVSIVVSNPPPTVSFTANPVSGNLPLTVNFDATACNDSNGIASYAWSFGDGTNVTTISPTISHLYSNGGTYIAKLTVTDTLGASGSTSMTINVIDPNVLNTPTNLIIQAGARKATLTWSDKSGNESGFYIERGVKSRSGIKYTRVGSVVANVTTYTDSLTTANTYYYRIQAYNANGVSGYSNAVSARIR
jgi:PKD repeat protein/C1A family cysteine protease